jgi:hypothetical protein
MTKVMMTFHLTVLHFLPLNPNAPSAVLRTLYSVLPLNSFARPCRRVRGSPF